MLTFLRKIRYTLSGSGAKRQYLVYAIGEVLLVMIGILLALQVNNWNQYHQDRKKETQALINLRYEFVDNRYQFNATQDLHNHMFGAMRLVLDVIDNNRLDQVNRDSLYTNLLISSFTTPTYNPSQAIINSLMVSGDIDLVQNDSLKLMLIGWKDLVGDYNEEEVYTERHKFTYLYPRIKQIIRFPSRHRDKAFAWEQVLTGSVDRSKLRSMEFYNDLAHAEDFSDIILVDGREFSEGRKLNDAIEKILNLIENELNGR